MKDRETAQEGSKGRASKKAAAHTVAEWVTLVTSALLILGLASYLLYEAFQANEPFVPVNIEARVSDTRQAHGQFMLPVRISNRGGQTLRDLKIELRSHPPGAAPQTADVLIDYLGEGSEQTAYFYFDRHPSELKVEPRAISYRVE